MNCSWIPKGTCSRKIRFRLENGAVHDVRFTGGCNGNLQGVARLVDRRPAAEVAELLEGIRCGRKKTSCPDQLAKAIRQALTDKKERADNEPV